MVLSFLDFVDRLQQTRDLDLEGLFLRLQTLFVLVMDLVYLHSLLQDGLWTSVLFFSLLSDNNLRMVHLSLVFLRLLNEFICKVGALLIQSVVLADLGNLIMKKLSIIFFFDSCRTLR